MNRISSHYRLSLPSDWSLIPIGIDRLIIITFSLISSSTSPYSRILTSDIRLLNGLNSSHKLIVRMHLMCLDRLDVLIIVDRAHLIVIIVLLSLLVFLCILFEKLWLSRILRANWSSISHQPILIITAVILLIFTIPFVV